MHFVLDIVYSIFYIYKIEMLQFSDVFNSIFILLVFFVLIVNPASWSEYNR